MTRSEFRDRVNAYMATEAQPYETSDSDINAQINELLPTYSGIARCLFSNKTTLTLVAGTAVYDLRGPEFGNAMEHVLDVFVDGSALGDMEGYHRSMGYQDAADHLREFGTASDDQPRYWLQVPPHSIQLFPAPDSVYSDTFVTGFYRHPAMTDDADELVIPDELLYPAAMYVAAHILDPRAAGASLEKKNRLMAESVFYANDWKSRSLGQIQGGQRLRNRRKHRSWVRTI